VPPLAASVTTPLAEVVAALTFTTGAVEVPEIVIGALPVTEVTEPELGDVQDKLPDVSEVKTCPELEATDVGKRRV
jgi:hypothetical protein